MTVVCPNGHQSDTADYCDQCGAKIGGTPAPNAAPAPKPPATPPVPVAIRSAGPASGPAQAASRRPRLRRRLRCGVPGVRQVRVGDDRFCEGCGYDFTSAQPPVSAIAEGSARSRPGRRSSPPTGTTSTGSPPKAWSFPVTARHGTSC